MASLVRNIITLHLITLVSLALLINVTEVKGQPADKSPLSEFKALERAETPLFIFVPGIFGSKIEHCSQQSGDNEQCSLIWGEDTPFSNVDMRADPRSIIRTSILTSIKPFGYSIDIYGEALRYLADLDVKHFKLN